MHEGAADAELRLSVVVSTGAGWSGLSDAVDSLARAIESVGIEVVAVSGAGGRPVEPRAGVTYVDAPEPDVFHGRAAGVARATGDIVALVEDHQRLDPEWAGALLDAWHEHPTADALVHSMTTSAEAGVWEVALFTIVSGPFLGVDQVPLDRLRVPGIVSFRRSLLNEQPPEPGHIEYELLAELLADGRIEMVDVPAPVHVQPAGWRAVPLAFHSARMFAGSRAADGARRLGELRRMRRELPLVFRQTIAARRRIHHGAVGARFGLCVAVLTATMVVGQIVGIATRSAGNSARHLD